MNHHTQRGEHITGLNDMLSSLRQCSNFYVLPYPCLSFETLSFCPPVPPCPHRGFPYITVVYLLLLDFSCWWWFYILNTDRFCFGLGSVFPAFSNNNYTQVPDGCSTLSLRPHAGKPIWIFWCHIKPVFGGAWNNATDFPAVASSDK